MILSTPSLACSIPKPHRHGLGSLSVFEVPKNFLPVKQHRSRAYDLLIPTGCKSRCQNRMRLSSAVSVCPMLRSCRRKKLSVLALNLGATLSVQGLSVLSIGEPEKE